MTTDSLFPGALDEICTVLADGEAPEVDRHCNGLLDANRIACYGVGREGLMMRALCLRLMHLGLDAHMVGDMTAPPLGKGDLLVVSAAPGSFSTVNALEHVAHSAGARVATNTTQPAADAPN